MKFISLTHYELFHDRLSQIEMICIANHRGYEPALVEQDLANLPTLAPASFFI